MKSPSQKLFLAGCLVTALFPLRMMAADPTAPRTRKVEKPTVVDLLLGRGGTLEGQLRDAGEVLADGATISIWQGHKLIWKGTPDEAGKFELKDVRTGVYRVVYGGQSMFFRAWSGEIAPPQAKGSLMLNRENPSQAPNQPAPGAVPAGALFPPIWSSTHGEFRLPGRP